MMDNDKYEVIEQVFNVNQPASMDVSNIRGLTSIIPGPDNVITVTANKILGTGDDANTWIVLQQDGDGHVRVETRYDNVGGLVRGGRPCRVEYTIQVPEACDLRASGVSSATTIRGVSGKLKVQTVNGKVQLENLAGKLDINAVSGDVSARDLTVALVLETVSGDVSLMDCKVSEARVNTVSGDVRIQTELGAGPYLFRSISGDVILDLPALARCSVISDSLSGKLKGNLPVMRSRVQPGRSHYEVQGGGTTIQHNSVSGDIVVNIIGKPGEKTPGVNETSVVNTAEVLERIDRGELSVDEALKIMETMHAN